MNPRGVLAWTHEPHGCTCTHEPPGVYMHPWTHGCTWTHKPQGCTCTHEPWEFTAFWLRLPRSTRVNIITEVPKTMYYFEDLSLEQGCIFTAAFMWILGQLSQDIIVKLFLCFIKFFHRSKAYILILYMPLSWVGVCDLCMQLWTATAWLLCTVDTQYIGLWWEKDQLFLIFDVQ